MDWRERFLIRFGPGLLGGVTVSQWWRLLADEHLDFSRFPRSLAISVQSLKNSAIHRLESARFHPQLANTRIDPPLFILGHWRNGTTHLHQLLAQDPRFAFPNSFQTAFPHTFLTTEAADSRLLSFFIPKRRPMDNMEWTLASPQEDEFALCTATCKSPCMAWIFPRRRHHFSRYLSFREVSEAELAEWRAAFILFLKKLTLKYQRRLVLKSPPHTARIRLLLDLFPRAQFVHIHRHPYTVFQSTRKTFEKMFAWQGLQEPDLDQLEDWILDWHRQMYDSFFHELHLIPPGDFHELAFHDLEKDPITELRKLYSALRLPDFQSVEPALRQYVDSLAGYQKNQFPDLPPRLASRVAEAWQPSFQAWGYRA